MESILPTIIKKIFDELGSGYKEHIYQKAIEIEFQNENILFHSEVICPITYCDVQVSYERADIVVYSQESKLPSCILELKAQTSSITRKEFIQLCKYMINLKVTCGYIINFVVTADILLNKTDSNYRYLELYKIELDTSIKISKYSFKTSEYKEAVL